MSTNNTNNCKDNNYFDTAIGKMRNYRHGMYFLLGIIGMACGIIGMARVFYAELSARHDFLAQKNSGYSPERPLP